MMRSRQLTDIQGTNLETECFSEDRLYEHISCPRLMKLVEQVTQIRGQACYKQLSILDQSALTNLRLQ